MNVSTSRANPMGHLVRILLRGFSATYMYNLEMWAWGYILGIIAHGKDRSVIKLYSHSRRVLHPLSATCHSSTTEVGQQTLWIPVADIRIVNLDRDAGVVYKFAYSPHDHQDWIQSAVRAPSALQRNRQNRAAR